MVTSRSYRIATNETIVLETPAEIRRLTSAIAIPVETSRFAMSSVERRMATSPQCEGQYSSLGVGHVLQRTHRGAGRWLGLPPARQEPLLRGDYCVARSATVLTTFTAITKPASHKTTGLRGSVLGISRGSRSSISGHRM
jgi:hypothetical protein